MVTSVLLYTNASSRLNMPMKTLPYFARVDLFSFQAELIDYFCIYVYVQHGKTTLRLINTTAVYTILQCKHLLINLTLQICFISPAVRSLSWNNSNCSKQLSFII